MKDYYKILGVEKGAGKEEVKRAYRKLAHQHHPDKKGGDEAKFKEINEAYYVLGDDSRRAQYDQTGRTSFGGGGGPQSGFDFEDIWRQFGGAQGGARGGDFADIFGDIFGFGGGGQRQKRGADIAVDIELPFAEAAFGTNRKISLRKTNACKECDGSGAKSGTGTVRCEICNGSGTVRENRRSMFGSFTALSECSRCHGKGEMPKEPCPQCRGEGIMRSEETIEIAVPAGIDNGEMIRVTGAGEAVAGGRAGDLYVRIHVRPDPRFHREGMNLISDVEIPFTDAALGTEKVLETLDGKVKMEIPAGTNSGDMLRIRARGIPKAHGRGDLLIRVTVRTPKKLSRKARELMDELRREGI
ncbi:MAG: molecular chaperone DnaJ [Candidatus Niyogibacteria bacterium]|nr:molecular chaperone DnaJ [Candidatus Niyogibacteria bacterium]